MLKVSFAAILVFLFGLVGEARARPIDEVGWKFDSNQFALITTRGPAGAVNTSTSDTMFGAGSSNNVKVDYQCGTDSDNVKLRNHCLLRVVDTENHAVCYSMNSNVLTCVSRK